MSFETTLILAKDGDAKARSIIFDMYKAYLISQSIVNGEFQEDLHHELIMILLNCIDKFTI